MNNSKKFLFLIVMLLLIVIGVSLAYFGITIIDNDPAKNTGTKEVSYSLVWTELTNEITDN